VVKAGGGKRRLAQMEHTRALLAPTGVLRHISEDELRRLLHEETLVVEFEPQRAKATLPKLVETADDRQKLNRFFDSLEADVHLDARQRALLGELRRLVPRPPLQLAPVETASKAKGGRRRGEQAR
jgi:hypothetical protein